MYTLRWVLQQKLFETLQLVEAAPGTQINTGATSSSTTIAGPPDMRPDVDPDDIRYPDSRVRDEDVPTRHHRAELYDRESDVDADRHHEPEMPDSKRPRLWNPDEDTGDDAAPSTAAPPDL